MCVCICMHIVCIIQVPRWWVIINQTSINSQIIMNWYWYQPAMPVWQGRLYLLLSFSKLRIQDSVQVGREFVFWWPIFVMLRRICCVNVSLLLQHVQSLLNSILICNEYQLQVRLASFSFTCVTPECISERKSSKLTFSEESSVLTMTDVLGQRVQQYLSGVISLKTFRRVPKQFV